MKELGGERDKEGLQSSVLNKGKHRFPDPNTGESALNYNSGLQKSGVVGLSTRRYLTSENGPERLRPGDGRRSRRGRQNP